jgi:plasmid stability protein
LLQNGTKEEKQVPANLSIKNVPDRLMERLRARAQRNHRSLQGELMTILEDTVGAEETEALGTLTIDESYRRIQGLGLRTGSESVAMIREDRDAR